MKREKLNRETSVGKIESQGLREPWVAWQASSVMRAEEKNKILSGIEKEMGNGRQ